MEENDINEEREERFSAGLNDSFAFFVSLEREEKLKVLGLSFFSTIFTISFFLFFGEEKIFLAGKVEYF